MLVIPPNAEVRVIEGHPPVAVAAPGAGTLAGLQPKSEPGGQNVNEGGAKTVSVTAAASSSTGV